VIIILSVFTVITRHDFVDRNIVVDVADFPLDVEVSGVVFSVGDKLSGTATITNTCGKNVIVESNGYQPSVALFNISDTDRPHIEPMPYYKEILRPNGKISQDFVFELSNPGTYALSALYRIDVNGVWLFNRIDDIIIEVK